MSSPVSSSNIVTKAQRTQQTRELFDRACATQDPQEHRRLLDEVIVLNMAVAEAIVSRYTRRGVPAEDLLQVAYTALTRAAHRFDPAQGTEFAAFAVPSIRGEICKHFRDHAWMVRPTRRIQELQPQINRAEDALWRELGRSPQPTEVAERIGEPVDVVMEALSTDGCFSPSSLDKPVLAGESRAPLGDLLGVEDTGQECAEARVILRPLVRKLSERDRRILEMRFVQGLTQREIAEEIGVTQMQVSRLLTRIYRDLRAGIGELECDPSLKQSA
jgi:RNA polymerase sigma-B factor